jgi:hypothetical protein
MLQSSGATEKADTASAEIAPTKFSNVARSRRSATRGWLNLPLKRLIFYFCGHDRLSAPWNGSGRPIARTQLIKPRANRLLRLEFGRCDEVGPMSPIALGEDNAESDQFWSCRPIPLRLP